MKPHLLIKSILSYKYTIIHDMTQDDVKRVKRQGKKTTDQDVTNISISTNISILNVNRTPNTTITLALTQSNQSIYRIYENQSIELHYSNPVFQICASFAWNCKLQVPRCLYKSYTDEDEFKARLL